ncbi:MAG: NF038122 family metalloprotease [Caulobacteraceae bacterium]
MKLGFAALSGAMTLLWGAPLIAGATDVINPIFASSVDVTQFGFAQSEFVSLDSDPAAEAAITAAANQVASQFDNGVISNIVFVGIDAGTNGFLGASSSGQTVYTYSQYVSALAADAAAHPSNTILNTAVANLASGNGASHGQLPVYVAATTPDARALGLDLGAPTLYGTGDSSPEFDSSGNYVGGGGTADGVIFLNLDQPLSFMRPIQNVSEGVAYDAETVMEHEIDEIMGIGGAGSQLNNFNDDPNYARDFYGVRGELLGPMDLYRYAAPGVPSFDPLTVSVTGCGPPTCSGDPSPYFSVDGGLTSIDTFNQAFALIGGDAGDWGLNLSALCPGGAGEGGTGDVQDAFSCNNHVADVSDGKPSFYAFEAIGYDLPEPATWAIMLAGLCGLGAALRLKGRRRGMSTG